MKPTKCDEIYSTIIQLGRPDIPAGTAETIISHLDQCALCEQEYGYFRAALAGDFADVVTMPKSSTWESFPENVLQQVNEIKALLSENKLDKDEITAEQALIYEVEQKANEAELKANEAEQTAEFEIDEHGKVSLISQFRGKASSSSIDNNVDKVGKAIQKSTTPRLLFQIAASVLLVVTVVLLMGKPGSEYQHFPVEFQMRLSQTHAVSQVVTQLSAKDSPTEIYSFIEQANGSSGFVVGSYFAEALALVDASDRKASAEHLQDLQQKMKNNKASDASNVLLQKTIRVLSSSLVSRTDRIESIAHFAEEYINHLEQGRASEVVYFRLGAWTVNMAIGASSKSEIIRAEKPQIDYFLAKLSGTATPQGVIKALQAMRGIIDQPTDAEMDYRQFLQFSVKLRRLLA